ncbi:MAG: RNA polymerase sigma factor [Planctomycetaceae bacterium]
MSDDQQKSMTRLLFERAQAGERAAVEQLLERIRPRLEVWVAARLGAFLRARVDAEDIVQEILLKAYQGLPNFVPQGKNAFYGWLFTIAEHRIIEWSDKLRAAKRGPGRDGEMVSDIQGTSTTPSKAAARKEDRDRVFEALAALSERYREIIRLRRLEELSNEEAGARMGITGKNASVLYVRALESLRKQMGVDPEGTGGV